MWKVLSKLIPKFKTSVSIVPTGSHVVVLALVGTLVLSLGCSFLFIWHDLNYWPPLVSAGILFVAIVFLWLRSHRHVDDRSLPPAEVTIKDGITETTISMHPRGLPSSEQLNNFENILSVIQHQRLLPEPDGLVNEKGNPIPRSEEEARQIVDAVNNEVKQKFVEMNLHPSVIDQPNETMQSGLSIEPNLEEIKETNRPSDECPNVKSKKEN